MNNYCTNCGKELEKKAIKCNHCNTYVIDIKKENMKKIFKILKIAIIIIILSIILGIITYILYYENLSNTLYKKYVENDYPSAEFVKYEYCHECDGSCEGACYNSPKKIGCFKYYYKSSDKLENSDIIVFTNRGKISIDAYSYIINKYGYKEENEEEKGNIYTSNYYLKNRRDTLTIKVNDIENEIDNIYKMVNELTKKFKEDDDDYFKIYIQEIDHKLNYEKDISIRYSKINNKDVFKWNINYRVELHNPTLEEIKNVYKRKDYIYKNNKR